MTAGFTAHYISYNYVRIQWKQPYTGEEVTDTGERLQTIAGMGNGSYPSM